MILAGGRRGWDRPAASDEELMARMAGGEVEALEVVYDRYGRMAYSLALRVLGDRGAAEEVVQDAFVGLWRAAGSYDARRGGLYPWLVRIVRNRAIDELRRLEVPGRAARKALSLDVLDYREPYGGAPNPDGAPPSVEDRIAVSDAVLKLPEEQRLVIELAYYGGLSQREISEKTGLPLGTVKTRTRLALSKLRAALGSQGGLAAGGTTAGEAPG